MSDAGVSAPRVRQLALVLLVAGVLLRAWAVGHARFTGDESYFWATARNVATLDAAPVYGPPMTGSEAYHPGPIFYYLMAVPQRLGASPWFGGLFVALLHTLSSALLGLLARRAWGDRAGLIALALVAFAPWDVLYADRIWLSCVAPVWGALILYAATRLDSARWQGALVFFALTCPQLHMSAPVVWVAAGVLALGTPRPWRVAWRPIGVALVLVLLAYAAPLVHELTHDFVNTRAILTKGGGQEPWDVVRQTPLKVLGYAVLAATSELGYHFDTGYWRPFDERVAYFSSAGQAAWWARHGVLWGALTLGTVLLSLLAWGTAVLATARAVLATRTADPARRAPLPLGDRVTLALVAGLLAATALMVLAKKPFFPHYTNLLMPLLLWPVVRLWDQAWSRGRRALATGALALTALAMASGAVRYYLEVDRRNGMSATVEMVERALAGPAPLEVSFTGFYNRFAWEMLANTRYKRPLPLASPSGGSPPAVRYRVHNGAVYDGRPLSPGATLHDGVVLEAE